MKKRKKTKARDLSLDELYGCAVPTDCDLGLYTDIKYRAALVPLYEENGNIIVGLKCTDETSDQDSDPFYGKEQEDVFSTVGYAKDILLLSERVDENGYSEFYTSGKTAKWVRPNVA